MSKTFTVDLAVRVTVAVPTGEHIEFDASDEAAVKLARGCVSRELQIGAGRETLLDATGKYRGNVIAWANVAAEVTDAKIVEAK